MKKTLLFVFALVLTTVSFAQEGNGNRKEGQKSNEAILAEVKAGKAYLIDVRTPEEYGAGHLKYSQNIDYRSEKFKSQISRLDKQKPVYLYCRSGNRSGKAADSLQTWGFKTSYNLGGLADLQEAGLAAEK